MKTVVNAVTFQGVVRSFFSVQLDTKDQLALPPDWENGTDGSDVTLQAAFMTTRCFFDSCIFSHVFVLSINIPQLYITCALPH